MYKNLTTRAIFFLAIVCAAPVTAEVYRTIDENGNVTFSNLPTKGAERVQLKPLSVYSAPVVKAVSNKTISVPDDKASHYESVEILSPKAEETLRSNPGNITIVAGSKPALDSKSGHRFQFFLDGKPIGKPQSAETMTINAVDRGEHKVAVAIVDAKGKQLLRSKESVFFLHRQTVFNPARN